MTRDVGRFIWFELITEDIDRATAFYAELFGWNIASVEMPNGMRYPLISVGKAPIGGIMRPPVESMPSHWMSYVSVDEVDATARRVVAAGGKALADAFDVPGYGRVQTVQDPHGGVFGLWRGVEGDVDAPRGTGSFHWNELWTTDPEATVGFYETVLGYAHDVNPMPMGEYFILRSGDVWRGGVMGLPVPGVPPMWMKYVAVDDCDAAVARAKKGGGRMLSEPTEMSGVGRFAVVMDPGNAAIGLVEPEHAMKEQEP